MQHVFIPLRLLSFAAARLSARGLGGAGTGTRRGALLPTHALQHRQHLSRGTTSLGHPKEDRVGTVTRNPWPPPLRTSTLLRWLLQQLATGHPWVVVPCSASQGVPHSFPRHRELPLGQRCPSHVGMTNHPGTCTSLGVPRMMYSARLCTGAGAKPWQPQQAAGQHIFVLRSERL